MNVCAHKVNFECVSVYGRHDYDLFSGAKSALLRKKETEIKKEKEKKEEKRVNLKILCHSFLVF